MPLPFPFPPEWVDASGDVMPEHQADFDAAYETWTNTVQAEIANRTAVGTVLADALNLAALYPAPTPEENAIIESQLDAALTQYNSLENPPADVVSMASKLIFIRFGSKL